MLKNTQDFYILLSRMLKKVKFMYREMLQGMEGAVNRVNECRHSSLL